MLSLRSLALGAIALLAMTATAAGQSSVPLGASPAPARDSRNEVPKVPVPKIAAVPQAPVVRQIPTQVIVLKPGSAIARKDSVCYALRTYQFDQATAGEAAKLSGQSTCVAAKTAGARAVATLQ